MSAVQYSLGLGFYLLKPGGIFQQVGHDLLGDVNAVLVGKDESDKGAYFFPFSEKAGGMVPAVGIIPFHCLCFNAGAAHAAISEAVILAAGLFRAGGCVSHNTIKIA